MVTEKDIITQKVSETLFILGAFNFIFLLKKKKKSKKEN